MKVGNIIKIYFLNKDGIYIFGVIVEKQTYAVKIFDFKKQRTLNIGIDSIKGWAIMNEAEIYEY